MAEFIKGLDLCESFYFDIVKPLLDKNYPNLKYSAGLLGYGSDVLGYDDAVSTDHMWGPRLYLFLEKDSLDRDRESLTELFSDKFPYEYKGYPTHYTKPDPNDNGVRRLERIDAGRVDPLMFYHTVEGYFKEYLGADIYAEPSEIDWLTFSEHRLLAITSGSVFRDDLGLESVRSRFEYYPGDVRLFMAASLWSMIGEEEAFVGRCGDIGDERGSRLIAARIVQRIMRLAFLTERKYAPYPKWFGSAFTELPIAGKLAPMLDEVLRAAGWKAREDALFKAYELLIERFGDFGVTLPEEAKPGSYFGRKYRVIHADVIAAGFAGSIKSPSLKKLPLAGSVSQFTDVNALSDDPLIRERLKRFYSMGAGD